MDAIPLLQMSGITKRFPGVTALDNVDFALNAGEVHALLGENGAGKSTLIKILAGIHAPTSGEIRINGEVKNIDSVAFAQECGIGVIHQEISLVPQMTVAQNIYMGREFGGFFVNARMVRRSAKELIRRLGFNIDPGAVVGDLGIAQRQMVEIAKALSMDSRILVMDEPTAAITDDDAERLFAIIRRLRGEGIGIIYISHRMDELFAISERITVLRDGRHVGTVKTAGAERDQLIAMMVGRPLEEAYRYEIGGVSGDVLEARNITTRRIKDVSVTLRRGEILGFAGLVGAGRTEFANAVFGIDAVESGCFLVDGKPVTIRRPEDAMRLGIVLVPEDRKGAGLVLANSVSFNTLLVVLRSFIKGCFVDRAKSRRIVDNAIESLRIKTPSHEAPVSSLSGGNQQKIVLSKWLAADPRIVILDEPTRGIDVGAKFEIYDLIFKLAKQNISVILISSELPEIINLSTRVAVMCEGRLAKVLDRDELTQESIMHYAMRGRD